MHATGTAVVSCCFRHHQQQQSSSAIVAGSREANSTYPAGVVVVVCLWCIYVQRTLLLSLLCCGAKRYAVFSYEYIDPTIYRVYHKLLLCTRYQVSHTGPKKSIVRVPSFTYYAPGITYTHHKSNTAPGTRYNQACFQIFVLDREHSPPQRYNTSYHIIAGM